MIILRQSGKSWKIHGKTLKGNAGSPISNILWGLRLSPERTSWQLWMTLKFHTLGSTKTKTAKKITKVIRLMSQCEPATELTTWHSQLKMFACKSRLDRNPFFRSARETIYTQHTAGTSCRFEALSPCNRQADSLRKTRDAQPFSQQKQQICHWDVLSPTSKCFCWIQMARFFDVFCWSILNPPPSCIRFFFHLELWRHRQISSAKVLKNDWRRKPLGHLLIRQWLHASLVPEATTHSSPWQKKRISMDFRAWILGGFGSKA